MGGSGSGNWWIWDAKTTTESQHRIDIRWMRKQDYLHPGTSGQLSWSSRGEQTGWINFRMEENKMTLSYRYRLHGGEWEDVEQTVSIVKTPCNYSGYRKWFLCPRCYKRVAVLYGAGKFFFCRHCYNLTYASSNASPIQRIFDKAEKLRRRLGAASEGFMDIIPQRPKGMHHKTYNRMKTEIYRLEEIGDMALYKLCRTQL